MTTSPQTGHVSGRVWTMSGPQNRTDPGKLLLFFEKKWIRQTDIFHTGWDIGPENVSIADVLINYAQYNATSYRKYLQPDIKWIVPVREPVSWMKSAVKYFQSRKLVPTNYVSTLIWNGRIVLKVVHVIWCGMLIK